MRKQTFINEMITNICMKRNFSLGVVFCLVFNAHEACADVTIKTFKDKSIQCDYLMIAPQSFISQAVRLAEHRNLYERDDVTSAKVVDIEQLYKEFRTLNTIPTFEAVHKALKWAHENWAEPFKYLVLVGDDSCEIQANGVDWNRGPMPTHVNLNISCHYNCDPETWEVIDSTFDTTLYSYSDNFYTFDDSTGDYDTCWKVAVGRIPCETVKQCSLYVDRVIKSELHPVGGPWTNSAIMIADDSLQKLKVATLGLCHISYCEDISGKYLSSYFVNKIYLQGYNRDPLQNHVLAGDDYFSAVNKGAFWTVYFGYGNGSLLSDEQAIKGNEAFRFRNGEMRGVFLSFTNSNGDYSLPFRRSMCKQFLFADSGGYTAYIASNVETGAYNNRNLALTFFSVNRDNPGLSLGEIFRQAQIVTSNYEVWNYHYLGDPAVKPYRQSDSIIITASGSAFSCSAIGIGPGSKYEYRILQEDSILLNMKYVRDSLIMSGQGTVDDTFFTVNSPLVRPSLRLIVYAWNDTAEARGTILLSDKCIALKGVKGKTTNTFVIRRNVLVLNDKINETVSVTVRSLTGRELFKKMPSAGMKTILLENGHIPDGMYIVEIRSLKGTVYQSIPWIRFRKGL